MEDEEILNINYHKQRLLVKALNCSPTITAAAKKLQVPLRTVYNLIEEFRVDRKEGVYVSLREKFWGGK